MFCVGSTTAPTRSHTSSPWRTSPSVATIHVTRGASLPNVGFCALVCSLYHCLYFSAYDFLPLFVRALITSCVCLFVCLNLQSVYHSLPSRGKLSWTWCKHHRMNLQSVYYSLPFPGKLSWTWCKHHRMQCLPVSDSCVPESKSISETLEAISKPNLLPYASNVAEPSGAHKFYNISVTHLMCIRYLWPKTWHLVLPYVLWGQVKHFMINLVVVVTKTHQGLEHRMTIVLQKL